MLDAGWAQLTDQAESLAAIRGVNQMIERDFIEKVFADSPTSALAGTLLARRLVDEGWKIRTESWARYVRPEQWRGFYQHLHRAEQILIEVTARHPTYTAAWVERLHTARGLSLGQAEARRRYEMIKKVAPNLYPAQTTMIQQLCPKWSGSYEAMHGFAVECARDLPLGAVNGGVVAEAHIEHWLLIGRDDGTRSAAAYLKRPEIQEELRWAAETLVLNPASRPTVDWVAANSSFAMVFSLAENYPAAAAHFNALYRNGNLAAESPWSYLGDPETKFITHRKRALKKGLRR